MIAAATYKINHDNPYRILQRFILANGEREYSGSETKRVKVEDNDVLLGKYTAYLSSSPKSINPFRMEIWFDSPTDGYDCRADVEFDYSNVSFDVSAKYLDLHTKTETGQYWDYFGDTKISGKIDLSKFDYLNYDDSISIGSITLKEDHEDFDGLDHYLDEKKSDPDIKGIANGVLYLTVRALEKTLDENNIDVTMQDLEFTSLEKSDRDFSKAGKINQEDDSDNSDNKETENQGEQSVYGKCKEEIISTGNKRSDDFFDGYAFVLPVENAPEDYLQGSIGVTEDSDNLYVLLEHHGTDKAAEGFRWKVRLDGEKGTYDLHLPLTINEKKKFADLSGSFDLPTYDKTTTFEADQVSMDDAEIDAASIEGIKTYPTSMITASVDTLYYWLNYSKIGVSIEELGFR